MPRLTEEQKSINRKAATKKYRDKNRDKYNDYSKQYYRDNREAISAQRNVTRRLQRQMKTTISY